MLFNLAVIFIFVVIIQAIKPFDGSPQDQTIKHFCLNCGRKSISGCDCNCNQ